MLTDRLAPAQKSVTLWEGLCAHGHALLAAECCTDWLRLEPWRWMEFADLWHGLPVGEAVSGAAAQAGLPPRLPAPMPRREQLHWTRPPGLGLHGPPTVRAWSGDAREDLAAHPVLRWLTLGVCRTLDALHPWPQRWHIHVEALRQPCGAVTRIADSGAFEPVSPTAPSTPWRQAAVSGAPPLSTARGASDAIRPRYCLRLLVREQNTCGGQIRLCDLNTGHHQPPFGLEPQDLLLTDARRVSAWVAPLQAQDARLPGHQDLLLAGFSTMSGS